MLHPCAWVREFRCSNSGEFTDLSVTANMLLGCQNLLSHGALLASNRPRECHGLSSLHLSLHPKDPCTVVLLKQHCILIDIKYKLKMFMFLKTNGYGDKKHCGWESWPFSTPQSLWESTWLQVWMWLRFPRGSEKPWGQGGSYRCKQTSRPLVPSGTLRKRRLSWHRGSRRASNSAPAPELATYRAGETREKDRQKEGE